MSDLIITKWDEKKLDTMEQMKVCEPVRIKEAGDPAAKGRKVGSTVKVQGLDKKDMYFQLKICYPKDFDAVMKYKKGNSNNDVVEVADKKDATPATGKKK